MVQGMYVQLGDAQRYNGGLREEMMRFDMLMATEYASLLTPGRRVWF